MGDLSTTLSERILETIQLGEIEPIRSTTGTRAAVDLLAARTEALEEAVRELAIAVQQLTKSQHEASST